MSPRRRSLVATGVAVAVVTGAAVVLLTGRGSPEPSAYAPQDRPGHVLLVPGYGGSTAGLEVLAGVLRAAGRTATVVGLPGNGMGDLRDGARALDVAAERALDDGAPSVDVIGYSAGGVTARYWVQELGGRTVARRVVTLGSPHHGTELAALGALLATGACPAGCRQLIPNSDLLEELNSVDETPAGPLWVSLWTTQDDTVTPPVSARLEGAINVQLQDVCPGVAVSHSGLPRAPLVIGLVLRALAVPVPLAPQPTECAALHAAGGTGR